MRFKDIALFLKRVLVIWLVVCLLPVQLLGVTGTARAESYEEYQLMVGDIMTIPTRSMTRISITDPDVADISDAKPDGVTLMGMMPGETTLFIWEEGSKRMAMIRVISGDLMVTKMRLQSLFESAGINTVEMNENTTEGKLVLTGDYPEARADDFSTITDQFSDKLFILSKSEDSKDLVQIDVQITDLGTTLTKEMGVKWSPDGMGIKETLPETTGEWKDIFKIGEFNPVRLPITAVVNALLAQGKARVVSKPRLIVSSGKAATFLVGGEVPMSTTTTTDTGTSSNVEYKEYGVSLSVTPTIKEGKIELTISTEISDVDDTPPPGAGTSSSSFLTQSVQTEVLMDDRQTIVLAGLIRKKRSRKDDRVPLLGSIPIVGLLFRHVDSGTATDAEIVISLTATILPQKKVDTAKVTAAEIKPSLPRSEEPQGEEDIPPLPGATSRDTIGLPTITKNAGTVSASVSGPMAPYVQMVQERIAAAIAFPYDAQQNGWQGTVKLLVIIKKDGSLRDVFVKESSGYEAFDQDALNTTQILAPYPPFSDSIKEDELSLTIPIVYSLDSFLKNVAKRN